MCSSCSLILVCAYTICPYDKSAAACKFSCESTTSPSRIWSYKAVCQFAVFYCYVVDCLIYISIQPVILRFIFWNCYVIRSNRVVLHNFKRDSLPLKYFLMCTYVSVVSCVSHLFVVVRVCFSFLFCFLDFAICTSPRLCIISVAIFWGGGVCLDYFLCILQDPKLLHRYNLHNSLYPFSPFLLVNVLARVWVFFESHLFLVSKFQLTLFLFFFPYKLLFQSIPFLILFLLQFGLQLFPLSSAIRCA